MGGPRHGEGKRAPHFEETQCRYGGGEKKAVFLVGFGARQGRGGGGVVLWGGGGGWPDGRGEGPDFFWWISGTLWKGKKRATDWKEGKRNRQFGKGIGFFFGVLAESSGKGRAVEASILGEGGEKFCPKTGEVPASNSAN